MPSVDVLQREVERYRNMHWLVKIQYDEATGSYCSEIPELNIASMGLTRTDALEGLEDALAVFFETVLLCGDQITTEPRVWNGDEFDNESLAPILRQIKKLHRRTTNGVWTHISVCGTCTAETGPHPDWP